MCLVRGVKILSTFAYIFNRRNNMIIKYLILGVALFYVVTVIINLPKAWQSEANAAFTWIKKIDIVISVLKLILRYCQDIHCSILFRNFNSRELWCGHESRFLCKPWLFQDILTLKIPNNFPFVFFHTRIFSAWRIIPQGGNKVATKWASHTWALILVMLNNVKKSSR